MTAASSCACKAVVARLYFGSPDRRDGGKTVRALRAYLPERERIARPWANRHQGRLLIGFDGWPLLEGGARAMLEKLAREANVSNVHPHRFRHSFASWYLVRHPGDETGLRGILGHLGDDMYRTYTHIAHEIIAQRAGRVSLSEAWLGSGDEPDTTYSPAPAQVNRGGQQPSGSSAHVDRETLVEAVRNDPELRKALLQALIGAPDGSAHTHI